MPNRIMYFLSLKSSDFGSMFNEMRPCVISASSHWATWPPASESQAHAQAALEGHSPFQLLPAGPTRAEVLACVRSRPFAHRSTYSPETLEMAVRACVSGSLGVSINAVARMCKIPTATLKQNVAKTVRNGAGAAVVGKLGGPTRFPAEKEEQLAQVIFERERMHHSLTPTEFLEIVNTWLRGAHDPASGEFAPVTSDAETTSLQRGLRCGGGEAPRRGRGE